jgi:hypothetical protein
MKVPEGVLPTAGARGDKVNSTFTGVDIGDFVILPVMMRMLTIQCRRPPGVGCWLQRACGDARLLACWGV